MKNMSLLLAFFASLLLVACAVTTTEVPEIPPTDQPEETPIVDQPVNSESPAYPEPDPAPTAEPVAYPEPEEPFVRPTDSESAYPPPGDADQPGGEPEPIDYDPKPGDENWDRGNVFIDEAELLLLESYPVQVKLNLVGNLPTPCNELRAFVSPPNNDGRIDVEIYSVVDPEVMCIQVEQPFNVMIALGDFTEGEFGVYANDSRVGEFSLP